MKKVLIIVGILILVVIAVGMFLYRGRITGNYTIPEDYIRKFENHQAYLDGADNDYYIYKNKIIKVQKCYYPVGLHDYTRTRTITEYNVLGADRIITLNGVYDAIRNKKGRVVLDEKE